MTTDACFVHQIKKCATFFAGHSFKISHVSEAIVFWFWGKFSHQFIVDNWIAELALVAALELGAISSSGIPCKGCQ